MAVVTAEGVRRTKGGCGAGAWEEGRLGGGGFRSVKADLSGGCLGVVVEVEEERES